MPLRAAVALAVFAFGAAWCVASAEPLVHAAVVGTALVATARARRGGGSTRTLFVAGPLLALLGWLTGPSNSAAMLRSFLHDPTHYSARIDASLVEGGAHVLADSAGNAALYAALAALAGVLAARLDARAWLVPAGFAGVFTLSGILAVLFPVTPEDRWIAAVEAATVGVPDLSPLPAAPPLAVAPAGPGRTVLAIVLESTGEAAAAAELAAHPDGGLARLLAHGVHFTQAYAAANVSHLSQPSIFTAHDFSHGLHRWFAPPSPHGPLTSMAAYFHAKGLQTHMRSGVTEAWLEMRGITVTGQPWTDAVNADDAPDFRDACGQPQRADATVLAEAEALLSAPPPEGQFLWLNLQDPHFPYRVVDDPALPEQDPDARCYWFVDMPAADAPRMARRHAAAVHATFEHVATLVDHHPDALVLLAGDHGETYTPGLAWGHGKSTSPAEIRSFAALVGGGLAPAVVDTPISLLDLFPTLVGRFAPDDLPALLPLVEGQDVLGAPRRGPVTSASHGFGVVEFALLADGVTRRRGPTTDSCTDLDGRPTTSPTCAAADARLLRWLACVDRYWADPPPGTRSPCRSERF